MIGASGIFGEDVGVSLKAYSYKRMKSSGGGDISISGISDGSDSSDSSDIITGVSQISEGIIEIERN